MKCLQCSFQGLERRSELQVEPLIETLVHALPLEQAEGDQIELFVWDDGQATNRFRQSLLHRLDQGIVQSSWTGCMLN